MGRPRKLTAKRDSDQNAISGFFAGNTSNTQNEMISTHSKRPRARSPGQATSDDITGSRSLKKAKVDSCHINVNNTVETSSTCHITEATNFIASDSASYDKSSSCATPKKTNIIQPNDSVSNSPTSKVKDCTPQKHLLMFHLNVHDALCTNVIIIFQNNNLLDLKYHVFYLGCE